MNGTIVPDSSNGEGNTKSSPTKQISPAKRWCFTLNNYTDLDISSIRAVTEATCKIAVVSREVGEGGTPHLQGYLEFIKKVRPVNKFHTKRIHFEKCKGNRQENYDYCTKDGDIVIMQGMDMPYKLELTNLYDWEKQIIEIVKGKPDDRSLYWFWEDKGCAGKTTFCKYLFTHFDDVIVLSGKAGDMKHGIVEFKARTGRLPKIVLINIPRCQDLQFLSYQGIEEIKDMFFFSGKYEGGMVCGANPHLIIFSNERPYEYKCSADRWRIFKIE